MTREISKLMNTEEKKKEYLKKNKHRRYTHWGARKYVKPAVQQNSMDFYQRHKNVSG